jgi:hypothetical protein
MTSPQSPAHADAVNVKLLELLEQLVANQTIKATAELQENIAERLTAEQRRRDPDVATGFDPEQARLVMRFRALRNGLGNLSRLSSRDVVLMPAPMLSAEGTLVFAAPTPNDAETARIFGTDGRQIQQFDGVGGEQVLRDVNGDVAYLQIDDRRGVPILLGVPERVDNID